MARCGECPPNPAAILQEVGQAVASAVGGLTRQTVRFGTRRFDDGQLDHGRRILEWGWSLWLLAAAGLTWWLGRPAAFVFAGTAAVSWLVGHALAVELERRHQARFVPPRARAAHSTEPAPAPEPAPRAPDAQPLPQPAAVHDHVDDELAAMIAASREGR